MLETEEIVSFMAKFLMEVGSKGLMNPLEVKFLQAWARVIPRLENLGGLSLYSLGKLKFVEV